MTTFASCSSLPNALINFSFLIASDLDGVDCQLSDKPITLRQGERAQIFWGKGVSEVDEIGDANSNGIREIYIADEHPTRTADQIVLFHKGLMKDAVVFARDAEDQLTYEEAEDVQRIIEAGLWHQGLNGRQISNAVASHGAAIQHNARSGWGEM